MTVAALSPARSRAAGNPWLVAAVVVVPTFMEVLDTTIAVVALRYITGGLSATVDDGEWVLTSYLGVPPGWSSLPIPTGACPTAQSEQKK